MDKHLIQSGSCPSWPLGRDASTFRPLASACFRELVAAPHVVVRVNEWLHQAAREELDKTTQACGFAGRLVLLAEPDIAVGDCRIEWADGGVRREVAAVEAAIDEAVTRYIAGRRGEPYTTNEVAKEVAKEG